MAKWTGPGLLQYVGRNDRQLSIRGFEVSTAAVESALSSHPKVESTAVMGIQVNGSRQLIAFYQSPEKRSFADLNDHLQGQLPAYMIPSRYEWIESMPFGSDKLPDLGKLRSIQLSNAENTGYEPPANVAPAIVAPANATEKKLCIIWETLLKLNPVGTTDNFYEIGGDSLLAIRLSIIIQSEFKVMLDFRNFHQKFTVKDCAIAISQLKKSSQAHSLSNFIRNENELTY